MHTTYRDPGQRNGPRKVITPASDEAMRFYQALKAVQEAEAALEKAIEAVPDYTGQWDPVDFYGEEQEAFNRAVDAFYDAVRS